MFNADFYPTPRHVAEKMLEPFDSKRLQTAKILEPSAGKGDIAEAIAGRMAYDMAFSRVEHFRSSIHCVELEPELRATLSGMGYRIVGDDFLKFDPDGERYDLIVMNPPFSTADKHLLHAWDILRGGDIACLLPAAMLNNQHTSSRRLLATIIEENGSVENLGPCFEGAERKTRVDVVLVRLHKDKRAPRFDFDASSFAHESEQEFDNLGSDTELATRDIVGNLIADYDAARKAFADVCTGIAKLGLYTRRLLRDGGQYNPFSAAESAMKKLFEAKDGEAIEAAYADYTTAMKKEAWGRVFDATKMNDLVSKGVREDFQALQEQQQGMAFDKRNVALLLDMLFASRENIMEKCIEEAFDLLTKYHKENRVYVEGWKTNDAWKVNQKFILPRIIDIDQRWPTSAQLDWRRANELDDIDRAVAFLDGRKLSDVLHTLRDTITEMLRNQRWGEKLQSTYFELKCYKKGTVHFRFLDKSLWERFNMIAAAGKNWLPDDYKARNRRADKMGLEA